jgi:prophage regulatory protein
MPNTQVALSTSNQTQNGKLDRFLDLHEVEKLTSYKSSSIYKKIKEGSFPKQIKLGAKKSGWLESHIIAWMNFIINANQLEMKGLAM